MLNTKVTKYLTKLLKGLSELYTKVTECLTKSLKGLSELYIKVTECLTKSLKGLLNFSTVPFLQDLLDAGKICTLGFK
jgi:hypothetical protein